MKDDLFRAATCPACGYHVAVPFFDGGEQPLATLSWPATATAAQNLPRLPLDFVRCVDCGHVFNAAFDYTHVPYSEKPNLMFNRAANWSKFLTNARQSILPRPADRPVVVEIGHGDGSFLGALAEERPAGRYVGFDPHGAAKGAGAVEFRQDFFDPAQHLEELNPDLIVSRHVLEHFVNPLDSCKGSLLPPRRWDSVRWLFSKVPCIDRTLTSGRTVDFYYEHSSQFTTESFRRMLSRAATEVVEIGHGYGGEVVFGFVRLGTPDSALDLARLARQFRAGAEVAANTIGAQLTELHASGKRVGVWGGTGKSAAFMCHYAVDRDRFPLVVDSDRAKVGTFVPGTGQEIRFRDDLMAHPAAVIIIPPQWRAADIIVEMKQVGITFDSVLIEHMGRLIDFHRDEHPYR